jgi:histidine ammonia-lyase
VSQVLLDGRALTPLDVAAVARGAAPVRLDPAAARRNAEAYELGERLAAGSRPLYGATTGVGALLEQRPQPEGHGLRLLRSHAGGTGDLAPPEVARALLVVRANQLAAGAGGVSPALLDALVAALNAGAAPAVHELGGIGTGDLTALAETGLALAGEGAWLGDAGPAAVAITARDGLALMSSNAASIGRSALAAVDAGVLLGSAEVVVALGLVAARGNVEAYDARVTAARGHPGEVTSAARLRRLLDGPLPPGARLQDPMSYRCAPQVLGAAREVLGELEGVLARELNAGAENPLLVTREGVALHHGGFDATRLGLSLDGLAAGLLHVGVQSAARLSVLLDPRRTGLAAFLADATPGSSGALVLEYSAHAALAALRAAATPVAPGAVLAFGQEDCAPFSATSALQVTTVLERLTAVLAAELVAAVRALRMTGAPGPPLARRAYERAAEALPADLADRPLSQDLAVAAALLGRLRPEV